MVTHMPRATSRTPTGRASLPLLPGFCPATEVTGVPTAETSVPWSSAAIASTPQPRSARRTFERDLDAVVDASLTLRLSWGQVDGLCAAAAGLVHVRARGVEVSPRGCTRQCRVGVLGLAV